MSISIHSRHKFSKTKQEPFDIYHLSSEYKDVRNMCYQFGCCRIMISYILIIKQSVAVLSCRPSVNLALDS